jgi:pentafunctional AROM polypeptide
MNATKTLVLLALPLLALGFGIQQQQHPISIFGNKQRTARSMVQTNGAQHGAVTITNIFQDYTKPVVLLGHSSEAGELSQLAKSLSSHLMGTVVEPNIGSKDDMIFPNVIVLDFKDKDHTELAKSLYQDQDMLSIYVNVLQEGQDKEDSVFVPFSDYEVCIKEEGRDMESDEWSHIEWEVSRLVARALLPPAIPGDTSQSVNSAHLTMGSHTFFLSLSFPDITAVEPYTREMCRDVDAMEYRTDLLTCRDSRFDLIYGQQLLRRYCRPHVARVPALPLGRGVLEDVMPIVYTVRTRNQAGTYPDDAEGIANMFNLLEWGLRSGAEVLDVESAWDRSKTDALLDLAERRYSSQVLGSHHVVGKEIELEDAVELFENCALDGRAHGAKVVLSIDSGDKDRMAYEAALIAASLAQSEGKAVIPNISLILGDVGQFSRIINIPFTPVTHESLPAKAAPGQLTANEIMATRLLTQIFDKKKYCILGHNIAYSVSPQMHGAAFLATRLAHEYRRADVATVEEFIDSEFFTSADFGGCSVTIPHKQAIMPYVDVLSDAAREIGSVNTLIVKEEVGEDEFVRVIYGDNTDWKGIFNPLKRRLRGTSGGYALILGAGGTARAAAYAAEKLGLERIYYNRTPAKAEELVDAFGGTLITSLDESGDSSLGEALKGGMLKVVISTLPAAAEFELPIWVIPKTPIVFDVNYKPYYTKLLSQAEDNECQIVRGSEMLWEQGVVQFELWTERTAPYAVMKGVVLHNCIPEDEPKEDAFQ